MAARKLPPVGAKCDGCGILLASTLHYKCEFCVARA
jgi:hypothetical protein